MKADDVARQRVKQLLELARKVYGDGAKLAEGYVARARKIAQKHRFSISSKEYCKACGAPRIPGKTLRVRVKSQTLLYTCLACNKVKKYSYSSRKRGKSDNLCHHL